jgi:glycine dehydrogenase
MIAIRAEIAKVEAGAWPQDDNPLKHAPHTAAALLKADWPHAYTPRGSGLPRARPAAQQVLVAGGPRRQRLGRPQPQFCSCPPVSAYATS